MPEKPNYMNRFQFVKWFFFNKCHHPWTLYVELAFPPSVEAAQTLLMFDWGDAARSLLRPKGNRRARHGRKAGSKRGPRGKGLPEPTDLALEPAKKFFGFDTRKLSQGVKSLWTIDTYGQKWLGRFMMFEVIEEWLYSWAVLISAKDGAHCDLPAVRAEGVGGYAGGDRGYDPFTGLGTIWDSGGAFHYAGEIYMPAPVWMIVVSCHAENVASVPPIDPAALVFLTINHRGPGDHDCISKPIEGGPGASGDLICTMFYYGGEQDTAVFGAIGINGVWEITNVVVYAQAF